MTDQNRVTTSADKHCTVTADARETDILQDSQLIEALVHLNMLSPEFVADATRAMSFETGQDVE